MRIVRGIVRGIVRAGGVAESSIPRGDIFKIKYFCAFWLVENSHRARHQSKLFDTTISQNEKIQHHDGPVPQLSCFENFARQRDRLAWNR